MKRSILILTLALSASTCLVTAQEDNRRPGGPPPAGRDGGPGGERGGPGGPGGRRPMNPIIVALDLNNDGMLDADEIAKASASLKKLDKNGDGNITPEEYRPPGGPGGPGNAGPQGRGPRGPGGGDGDRPQRPRPE